MLNLLGEHSCKVDSKGRVMFPAKLRKQLEPVISSGLVLNRDIFEKCLILYPKPEWDIVNQEMSRLSRYDRKHQLFQRKFMKGATLVEFDATGRLLIPAALLDYAMITEGGNELVISGVGEKMEIWSKKQYDEVVLNADDDDLSFLIDDVRKDIERDPNTN
ncbi:MAG: division/cell wall cluster transcriptional repressor MraZ [Flavobacteriales bacterium]|nr:division/cell wall cluster transcriptional repressor MraZ [Flavobacteriales bacterium]MDG1767494.1 division/cell wall cluster transcriptional repressor MraZ [Flavobacteriales bacterium]